MAKWNTRLLFFLDMVQLEQYEASPSASAEADVNVEVNFYGCYAD